MCFLVVAASLQSSRLAARRPLLRPPSPGRLAADIGNSQRNRKCSGVSWRPNFLFPLGSAEGGRCRARNLLVGCGRERAISHMPMLRQPDPAEGGWLPSHTNAAATQSEPFKG